MRTYNPYKLITRKRVLTSKDGNRLFYKGRGSGKMGTWDKRGNFVVDQRLVRQFIVPDLSQTELTPYTDQRANSFRGARVSPKDYLWAWQHQQ